MRNINYRNVCAELKLKTDKIIKYVIFTKFGLKIYQNIRPTYPQLCIKCWKRQ